MRALDDIDRQILRLLQDDGRMSVQSLSGRVNLSARACLERVRRLERDRVIEGYRALVSREALAARSWMFVEVTLRDQRQATMQQFERHALRCAEVVGCWVVSGDFDYLVRVACRDLDHYRRLTDGWLGDSAIGVSKLVTRSELQVVKEFEGAPIE